MKSRKANLGKVAVVVYYILVTTCDFYHLLNRDILLSLLAFCGVGVPSRDSSSSLSFSGESQGATAEFLTFTPKPSLPRAEFGLLIPSDSVRDAVAGRGGWGRVSAVRGFDSFFRIGRIGRISFGSFISSASPAGNGWVLGLRLADTGGPSILTPEDLMMTSSVLGGISSVVVRMSSFRSRFEYGEAKNIFEDGCGGGVAGDESLGVRAGEA